MNSVIAKYARATNSSNLMDDELHHETDVLAAVAITSKQGSELLRIKYCGEEISIRAFLDTWRGMVLPWSIKGGWMDEYQEIADISLWAWLDDVCRTCHGRSHPVIPGTPMLEILVCPACNGTGRRVLECDAGIKRHVEDCVQKLDSMVRVAARKAEKKLR